MSQQNSISTPIDLSADELNILEQSALSAFLLVAGADNRINKKEITEFIHVLLFPKEFYSDLMLQTIDRLLPVPSSRIDTSDQEETNKAVKSVTNRLSNSIHYGRKEHLASLLKANKVLDKLAERDAEEFKLSLFHIGHRIANCSGGFLGFGCKICKQEKKALKNILFTLDIEIKGKLGKTLKKMTKEKNT